MSENKITGAMLVALPGAIQNFMVKKTESMYNVNYSVHMWLDDEKALYLHGSTGSGRSSGNFQGRYADQIGTQYSTFLESVLEGDNLIDAIQRVESVQIDSNAFSWNGSMDELLELLGLLASRKIGQSAKA